MAGVGRSRRRVVITAPHVECLINGGAVHVVGHGSGVSLCTPGTATGAPTRVAAATELHLRNGLGAILRHFTGDEGPDPFDVD